MLIHPLSSLEVGGIVAKSTGTRWSHRGIAVPICRNLSSAGAVALGDMHRYGGMAGIILAGSCLEILRGRDVPGLVERLERPPARHGHKRK